MVRQINVCTQNPVFKILPYYSSGCSLHMWRLETGQDRIRLAGHLACQRVDHSQSKGPVFQTYGLYCECSFCKLSEVSLGIKH